MSEDMNVEDIQLTEKQKIFCIEYLKDMNGTRAYKFAYPHIKNDNTAAAAASRLLRNVNVKKYIELKMKEIEEEGTADVVEIIMFLSSVMRGEKKEDIALLLAEGGQSLESKDTDIRDRLKAAELLGKRYGMWTDKLDVKGDVDVGINKLDGILKQLSKDKDSD